MSERRVYELCLRLKSPFLFQGTVNSRLGYDAAALRDENGSPAIPGTQVKGVLRAALEAMVGAGYAGLEVPRLFGGASQSIDDEFDIPDRGAARFGDLAAVAPGEARPVTRIAIDRETGSVATGAMQIVELAAPPGEVVDFTGTLVVHYEDGVDPKGVEAAIGKALKLIPSIGAAKSAGFGETVPEGCTLVERESERRALVPASPAPLSGDRLAFEVTFDRPIMVDAYRADHNIYKGSTIVPGAAFKGALAERLRIGGTDPSRVALGQILGQTLGQTLAQTRFSHAFPVDGAGQQLDLPIPFSMIAGPDIGEFADIASWQTGDAPLWGDDVPEFVSSAKDRVKECAREALGLPATSLQRLQRTHVAIDAESLAAEEGRLYSTELLVTSGMKWRLELDFANAADKGQAARIAAAIGDRVDGIGRTAATAMLTPADPGGIAPEPGETLTFCLVTPAVMFDGAVQDGSTMGERYATYFRDCLGGAVLENFFAKRKLAGGYLATRYRPYGKTYHPFVLTRAGSVFRLRLASEAARKAAGRALRFGLPVPEIGGRKVDWRTCPFVPENGYGEARTDLHGRAAAHPDDLVAVRAADVC